MSYAIIILLSLIVGIIARPFIFADVIKTRPKER